MEQQVKIAIELHEGQKSTKKIWRFDVSSAKSFTKSLLVNEIEGLFPHIKKKGLSLNLYHCDELAGKVVIESDADAVEALRRNHYMIVDHCTWYYMQMIPFHLHQRNQKMLLPEAHQKTKCERYNAGKYNYYNIIVTLCSLYYREKHAIRMSQMTQKLDHQI